MIQQFKRISLCTLLISITFHVLSQNKEIIVAKNYCATDNFHEGLYKNDKSYKEKFDKINQSWQEWAIIKEQEKTATQNTLQATGDDVLPVIFHMMIGGTTSPIASASATDGNLTKTQIQNALIVLNKIFAGQPTGSKPASLNTQIQFCLAEVDIKGAAITSYTYANPLTVPLDNNLPSHISAISNVVASTGNFPTTKYINIYVVDDIVGNVAGFAFMPSAHGQPSDGIYIEAQYLLPPVSGNDLSYNMTVLSHEMGHYLGLFHTFGICKSLTQSCSCYNNNCLFDGDMICDTPPDYSQGYMACNTTTNTCHTDNTPSITDGTHPATDINDLINNYMDYGNWNCENTFTAGQKKRMHFMIDKFIGPRNSLLNSTACNPVCANTCTVVINPITTTIVNGVNLPNTLILNGASVSYNFFGSLCGSFNTKNWSAINLTTNAVMQSATTSSFNVVFTSKGNYRILLKESVAGSNPLCYQTDTLDIQVLPPPNCPANLDMVSGWLNNWQRIQYEGGWARNNDGTFAFPTTTMTLVSPTTPNSTANLSPFSMVTSLAADPNFSTTALPVGITKAMRVGKMITTTGNILPGDAAYVTYTFSPTQENSKLRIFYLGMKEHDNGGYVDYSNFSSNVQLPTAFGFVCNYKFNSLNGNGIVERGLLHTGSNGNNIYGKNDMMTGAAVHSPTAYTTVQVGANMYDRMQGWEFQDLDFSLFACGAASPTITITFFARSDNSNNLGYKHSYAYFATRCLPGNFANTDLNLSNVDIACANNVSESCTQTLLPVPYNLNSHFNWGYYVDYRDMLKITTEESNNNITYTPSSSGYNITTSPPFAIPFVSLCKAPDNNPFKYFKITYSNLCQTKTDTISIFQGFVHDLTCAPNSTISLSGGHFINAPVPPSERSPDAYIQFCGTTTLNLTPPCWWQPGDPAPEYKWKYGVQEIPGETSASLVLGTSNTANYVGVCANYTRLAKYNDPYCGGSAWINSDVFTVTDLKHNYFNTNDIIGPDTCSNQPARIEIDNFYEQNPVSGCDLEILTNAQTAPTINSVTMSFFSNSNCTQSSSLTATSGPSVLTFTCLNSFSRYVGSYNNGPINTSFTFNNNGIYNQDGTVYMLVKVTRYGCTSTFTVNIPIKIKPSAIAGTIAPVSNGCLNPIQITGDDANVNVLVGIRYQWQYSYTSNFVSPVTIVGANTFSCNLPAPATFTNYPVYIRRVSLGTNDCQKPAHSNTVILNSSPYNLSVTASATTICQGSSVTLTASGAATYTWMPGNVTGAVKTFTPASTTIYTVTGTTNNGCTATKTISILVQPNNTPTITATSTSICTGSSVTLTATGSTSYTWTGGATTTTVNPRVVTPLTTTIYTVTNVCGSAKTITITVSPNPTITISPLAPIICAGTSMVLSASGAATYTWTGSGIPPSENPVTVSPTATTIYSVIGKNTTGCSSTKTVIVTVNALPTLSISPTNPAICSGAAATLTANGAVSYTWTGGVTAPSTANPRIVNPTVTTIYTVTGANSAGCKSTKTITVNVTASPALTVAPITSTICLGAVATLTASGAATYIWTDGITTYTSNPLSVAPSSTTIYTVTGIGANGCTGIKTAIVTVLPSPKLTVSPASPTICSGMPVTLTPSGAASYTWSSPLNGSTNTVTAGPITVIPNNTITYTVIGTNANSCKSSMMVTVNVNPKPSITAPASQTVCLGNSSPINITTTIGFTYSISPLSTNTIVPIDGQLIFYVTPTVTTVYTITVVNPVTGCSATSTTQIVVLPATPTINLIASSNPICAGSSVTLTASGALYYGWTGGGLTATSGTVVVTPTVTTKYTVYGSNTPFTVSPMTAVCYSRGIEIIEVLSTPTLSVSGPNISLCSGNCTVLSVSGANTYTWSTGVIASSVTICPNTTTNYTVTGTDINGCKSSIVKTVTTSPLPSLSISLVTPTICIGGSVTLLAAGATSYTWTGGGMTSFVNPTVVSPTITTTYTVTGLNGSGGCIVSKTITINVLPHIDKPVAIEAKTKIVCSGEEIKLSASGATTYVWTSNPTAAITQSITGAVIYSSVYSTTTFTVVGTESNGCKEQASVTVTVLPTPTVTAVASPTLICVKNTATLTASGAQTYTWTSSVSNAITQNSTGNPKVTNPLATNVTFTVLGTSVNGCIGKAITTLSINADCNEADDCKMINCLDGYIAAFRYLSPASVTSTSVTVRNGSMYMHQAVVPFGIYTPSCPKSAVHNVSYNWTLVKTAGVNAPQTICNNVTTKDFTWSNLSNGLYSLTMDMIIKETINGITYSCTLTRTSQFGIGAGYFITPPIFKIIADEPQQPTTSEVSWKAYPNPAANEVIIEWQNIVDEKVYELGLYDVNGKLLIQVLPNDVQSNHMFDTKTFPNGMYFIMLKTDKRIQIQKLALYK